MIDPLLKQLNNASPTELYNIISNATKDNLLIILRKLLDNFDLENTINYWNEN